MDIFEEILEDMKKDNNIITSLSLESLSLLAKADTNSYLYGMKYLFFGTYEVNKLLVSSKISIEQYGNIHKMILSTDTEMRDLGMNVIKQVRDEYIRENKEGSSKRNREKY